MGCSETIKKSVLFCQKSFFSTLIVGCDHGGWSFVQSLLETWPKALLEGSEDTVECLHVGCFSREAVDYPRVVASVEQLYQDVSKVKEAHLVAGLLVCTSGMGMSMAINRFAHWRGALCRTVAEVQQSRQHNHSNVLVLGAKNQSIEQGRQMVNIFLQTAADEQERHCRRVQQLGSGDLLGPVNTR